MSGASSTISVLPICKSNSARRGGTPRVTSIASRKGRPAQQDSFAEKRRRCEGGGFADESAVADLALLGSWSSVNAPVPTSEPSRSARKIKNRPEARTSSKSGRGSEDWKTRVPPEADTFRSSGRSVARAAAASPALSGVPSENLTSERIVNCQRRKE